MPTPMPVRPGYLFRALWPIHDMAMPLEELIAEALADLPDVAHRAHAELLDAGRFSIVPSSRVPGSGRVTENMLMFEAWARRELRTCPRCHVEVPVLVEGTNVCLDCDSLIDHLLPDEVA